MNKKLLAMLLAVAMIASLAVVPAAAAEQFPDAVGHWAESSIDRWADAGVVQGDPNGNINPGQSLTRAEMATILVRLLGLTKKADATTFSDVAEDDWFADAILKCAAAKIMQGDEAGRANPNDPITREQAITMVGRALGVKPQSGHSLERFVDADKVSAYAEEYMIPLTAMGILSGVGGSRVAPQDAIDRASVLALLDKAIARYVTTPGEVKADNANAFVVINVTDADAADVTVSGETAGVLVTTGNAADVKLKGLNANTVKVDAPVDVNVDGASKLGSVDVNAAANVSSKGVVGDIQLNDPDATSNVTTGSTGSTGSSGGSYVPSRPSRKKNVEDAEVLFITNADEYKAFFGEDMPTDHNIQLPWLVVSYTRNVAGTVTFSITKDGETVQFGTVAEGAAEPTLADTLSAEFEASNDNAYLSVHLYSQANTDHKGQDWLNQTNAGGSYVATVELDGDEAVSAAATYVDKTALNTAIAAATEAAEAIKTSTDGKDVEPTEKWVTPEVKAAYEQAIADAKAVADKADATQAELDAAEAALAEATTTFEGAKQDGTKPAPVAKKTVSFTIGEGATLAVKVDGVDATLDADKKLVDIAETAVVTFTVTMDEANTLKSVTGADKAADSDVYTVNAATVVVETEAVTPVAKKTVSFTIGTGATLAVKVDGVDATLTAENKLVDIAESAVVTFTVTMADTHTLKSVTGATEASGTYTVNAEAVTVETEAVTVPAQASTTTFATMSDAVYNTCTWTGKPAKDTLTFTPDETTATTIKVTGTLSYVENFTGFNETKPEEQKGYYVFFQMAVPTEGQTDGVITLKNAESGAADKVYNTGADGVLDTDGANKVFATIWHITDKTAQPQIEIDWDGEGEAYTATTYTLDFTGVTLAAKPGPVDANVTGKVCKANVGVFDGTTDESATLAPNYTVTGTPNAETKTTAVTITADKVVKHPQSESTAVEGFWLGFGMENKAQTAYTWKYSKDGTDYSAVGSVPGRYVDVDGSHYNTVYVELDKDLTEDGKFIMQQCDATTGDVLWTYNVTVDPMPTLVQDYAITKGTETNGTITVAEKAQNGTTVTITPAAASGYGVATVTVTKDNEADEAKKAVEVTEVKGDTVTYTFEMPADAVTVTVTFGVLKNVNISNTIVNGTVTADKTVAAAGSTVTLTVTPADGYEYTYGLFLRDVDNGKVPGGVTQGDTPETWTFTMPEKDVNVNCSFNKLPEDASDKFIVAPLGDGTDNSQLATKYQVTNATVLDGEYTVYVYAESIKAHESSDPTEAAEKGARFYIGAGLPKVENGYTLYVTTDYGLTMNKVRDQKTTVDGKTYSLIYAELSEELKEITCTYMVVANNPDGSENPEGAVLATYNVTFAADTLVPATEVTP